MKFTRIRNLLKRVPKKVTVSAAVLGVVAIVAIPAMVMAGFGPDRPTYDWNKYNPNLSCTDPSQAFGRCGSIDGPVFNSFINTPSYGDERNFTRIAEVVPGQSPTEADFRETSTAVAGKTYWVRTFVHNDANQNLNGANNDGISVAKDVSVRVQIADGTANGVDVMSFVNSSNAKQTKIWDTATLANANQKFAVNYVPGSASLYNGVHASGLALSDNIVSAAGTPIGYNAMDGTLPGCFDFSAYVYVKVEVKAPAIEVTKTARVAHDGSTNADFQDKITAKKTDTIDWSIEFKNGGNDVANDVTIRDTLPAGVTLVPGSITVSDANRKDAPLPDNALNAGGVDLGNYAHADTRNGRIKFSTTINPDFKDCTLHNVAYGRATNVPEDSDDSTVTIENCNPVTPVFTCDLLEANSLGDRKFSYTVHYTAKNATFKQVSYNFGDGSAPMLTDKTTVEHTYAADGTYTTKATVTFTVDGVDKTATSQACASTISASTPKDHCPIPGKENLPKNSPECATTPTTLPNTGAGGNMAAIFAATTVAGIAAYQVFVTRRLER